jgi:CRP/FNR family transcriptional regulator
MSNQAVIGFSKYKRGSYVLIEGNDSNDVFYIIKEGQVQAQRSIENIAGNSGETLKTGDFFGVISAMSGHPSTETVTASSDLVLLTVRKDNFGALIKQSAPLAMKIIRYFSKKLRFFDSLLTQMTSKKKEEESDLSNIFSLAEYYFNAGAIPLGLYAYQRYIDYVPSGENVPKAKDMLTRYAKFKDQAFNPPASITGINRKYKKDTFIFCEHEPGEDLFIIQSGKVKISKILGGNEVLLAVLKNGDIFGEMAILENQPRSASAIAYDGDVNILAVNKTNFASMVTEQTQLATRLITILSERIWSIYRQINNILLGDLSIRAYDTLLTIVLKEKVPIRRHEKYIFEFGAKELSNMMGLKSDPDKNTINTALQDKLFRVEANRIFCNDIEELSKRVQAYLKKLEIMRKTKKLN